MEARINVVASGTFTPLGTILAASGMPVFTTGRQWDTPRTVVLIDNNTGFLKVAESGQNTTHIPWEYPYLVSITNVVAAGYGWPTGNSIVYGAAPPTVSPRPARSTYFTGAVPVQGG